MMKHINKNKLVTNASIMTAGSFLLGLLAFAYMGSFMRLIGDDYFLAALLKSHGFWGSQRHAYMNHVYFHGNRFSQTFILILFSLFPPKISGIIPAMTIIALVFAIYFFVSAVLSHFNLSISRLNRFTVSVIVAFFTLYLAPTVKQGLYWRSSMVSSFGTNIGSFLLGALILWKKPLKWYWFPLIFIFAVFNAGLSENGAAYQAVMAGIILLFAIYLRFNRSTFSSRTAYLSLTTLIGTICAVVIMWRSPGILIFKREMNNSLMDAVILSIYHMYNFYKEIILSRTLDVVIIFGLGFMLFFLINPTKNVNLLKQSKRIIYWPLFIVVVQIITLLFIMAVMIPSAYTRNAYPDPRHFMGAVLVLMMAYFLTGVFCGAFIYFLLSRTKIFSNHHYYRFAVLVFVLISLIYPLSAIPNITSERLLFSYWARQWDQRHEKITQAAMAGEEEVHVIQLDHIIENVSELGPDPNSPTYNESASIYYGITIYADLPGWDEGFILYKNKHK